MGRYTELRRVAIPTALFPGGPIQPTGNSIDEAPIAIAVLAKRLLALLLHNDGELAAFLNAFDYTLFHFLIELELHNVL